MHKWVFLAIYFEFAKFSERKFEVGRAACRCPRSYYIKK